MIQASREILVAEQSEWKAIGDVTALHTEIRDPRVAPDETFKYVDISGIDREEKIVAKVKTLKGMDAPSRARKVIRTGDVLVSTVRPNLNAVALIPDELGNQVCSTGFCVLRANPDILPDYLFYFVRSSQFIRMVSGEVSGAMYPATTDQKIKEVRLPVPSLAEQRRIVDILRRADGIRDLQKQAQDTARQLIPALFIKMSGDPAVNQKGWPIRKVSDFVERFEGGKNLKSGSDGPDSCKILKVSAVTSGRYIEDESKPTPDDYSPPKKHYVRQGDLLFSRANTEFLVGATALVDRTNGKTLLPDKLWRFVWAEEVDPIYMHSLFQSHHVRKELSKLSTGTSASMRNISQGKLRTLKFPVAPYSEQKQFADRVRQIHAIQVQQSVGFDVATDTFRSVMSSVFNGVL